MLVCQGKIMTFSGHDYVSRPTHTVSKRVWYENPSSPHVGILSPVLDILG